ncbi:cache domain-containing sensor histidine kinase [Paenibacillus abyssi]|uniref:histidine kinase n=1 Tax=Paenibacillus abyssi TaxID=1340531 RepID=A0A917FS28_9BACL|nr:sensor histidine kinase [Paenibacillus abyssi]GGG00849.1 histidine kinase [Paenibacillus abyssi]
MKLLKRLPVPATIKQRFILIAILISFVPMIIISIFSTYTYTNATNDYVLNAMQNLLNSIDSNLNIMFGDVKDMVNIVSTLDVVQNISDTKDPSKWDLMKLMGNFTINKNYIKTILISNRSTMYYLDRNTVKLFSSNSVTYTYHQDFFEKINDWFSDIEENNTTGQWLDGKKVDLNNNAIFYGRAFKNMNTMDYIGMIVIGIDKNIFERLNSDKDTNDYKIVIMNQDNILYSSIDALNGGQPAGQEFIRQIHGGGNKNSIQIDTAKYMYSVKTNELTDWKIISLVNTNAMNDKNTSVMIMTAILILLSLFLTIGFVLLSSEKITRQIKLLTLAIGKFEKMEEIDYEFDDKDEVGKIGSEFQRVVNENKALTSNLYNAIIKQKEAELMALQSQINPHFLYNTLNSIYLMAEKIKAKNISAMVLNLSKIFKFALNRGESFTMIKNEIRHVESYLEIQKIRYEDKINVHIEICEDILYKKMVKFIIQPLVENAIYHGLEQKEGPGNLYIYGCLKGDKINFLIKDDGIGFDSESVMSEGRGIGIKNVDERIKLYYGDHYGLQINSQIGVGTEITVVLKDMN